MKRYKTLVNNSITFTIGSFGSKIITFLMVPLYTHVLTTGEYGMVDLITTTISLLLPILTLELGKSALRYVIEAKNEDEVNKIFSNMSLYTIIITIIIALSIPFINYFNLFDTYGSLFALLLLLNVINNLYSHFIRGIGLIKEFAINGILMTLITVLSNIILLVVFNFKIEGYIVSMIIATLVSNVYLFYSTNSFSRIKSFKPDNEVMKKMINYSIPIIPGAAIWWIINGSTRYFVFYFVGTTGNGLYAVASKIPALVSTLTNIFNQAWQLSSYEEYESEDKDKYYTKIFNTYFSLIFIISSSILVVLKPLLYFTLDASFYVAWTIAPFLIIGVIYQSLSSFLGTIYQASKETRGSLITNLYAGVASILFSIILVPFIGVIGAGVSTAISFIILFTVRIKDTEKYVKISPDRSIFTSTNIIFALQIAALFLFNNLNLIIIESLLFLSLIFVNKKVVKTILKVISKAVKSRI